jgi:hypothetical protein
VKAETIFSVAFCDIPLSRPTDLPLHSQQFERVPDAEILYPATKFKAELSVHLHIEIRKLKKWEPNVQE